LIEETLECAGTKFDQAQGFLGGRPRGDMQVGGDLVRASDDRDLGHDLELTLHQRRSISALAWP
jgi:hypothetical protein